MSEPRFSRIVIIQSLPLGESPTGRQLRDGIESTAMFKHGIQVDFVEAQGAKDFWKALEDIRVSTENTENFPVIHLECHGLSDKTGLSLGDGTSLLWAELRTVLTGLNQATRCNLLVTLAACQGARLIETLNVFAHAPCWGLMGPSNEVSPSDLISSYSAFFLELLQSGNTLTALFSLRASPENKAINFFFTAEDCFKIVFRLYRLTCSTDFQMTGRAERFTQILKRHGMTGADISSPKVALYKEELDMLKQFYRRFFFVDHFQENMLRFTNAYSAFAPVDF